MIYEDDKIRTLFEESKTKASENLERRIMGQIAIEQVLLRKRDSQSVFWRSFSTFLSLQAVVIVLISVLYFLFGEKLVGDNRIYLIMMMIIFICGVFFLISMFDDKRRFSGKKSFK